MENRESIIKVITTPLGFFALSLLIVEGFLGIIVIGSGNTLESSAKVTGMWLAFLAFVGVSVVVALMVWLIPDQLLMRGEDWMERIRMDKSSWRDSTKPTTKIEIEKLKATKK